MSQISTSMGLYRALYRYSKKLKLTDKDFYLRRVRQEFERNRTLEDETQIAFQMEVCSEAVGHSYHIAERYPLPWKKIS